MIGPEFKILGDSTGTLRRALAVGGDSESTASSTAVSARAQIGSSCRLNELNAKSIVSLCRCHDCRNDVFLVILNVQKASHRKCAVDGYRWTAELAIDPCVAAVRVCFVVDARLTSPWR